MNLYYKKIFLFLLLLVLVSPSLTNAVTLGNPLDAASFREFINGLANIIFVIAMAIVPIMVIIAAFYFVTAGDDPEKIKLAKKILLWTFIGILIVSMGRGVISSTFPVEEMPPDPPPDVD